ncbi:MAG: very short patch repair endonuclease [Verrucomicrobia bacterium]|nr:very short patch repair endonuclease [Verrucomicrobiota bacterium]
MPDVFTKQKRSQVMARIRSRGNRDTELALAAVFRRHGITGWRRHQRLNVRSRRRRQSAATSRRTAPGRAGADSRLRLRVNPDFVFPKRRLAVFVDGCFWHGCPRHATKPRQHAAFWRKKLAANKARDRKVNRALRAAGWRVLRIWEHELSQGGRQAERRGQRLLARLSQALAVRGAA